MDIYNFNNEDMIRYILTSDMTNLRNTDDFYHVITKSRDFMRFYMSYNENLLSEIKLLQKEKTELSIALSEKTNTMDITIATNEEECRRSLKRKLTWKERIFGKIDRIKR